MNTLCLLPIVALTGIALASPLPGGEACRQAAAQAGAAAPAATPPAASPAAPAAAPSPSAKPVGTIELAICLDTSGSMNGLIDSARARIWDIVSDLATATPAPKLRVALVTFGNDGHSAENGWTNVDSDFTDDLDMLSLKLFALTTNGGTELVGRVVDRAATGLSWTKDDSALKIVLLAGNESADQDTTVRYQDAASKAIGKGIMVNAIYCGAETDAIAEAWREVARLADGRSACIDQNSGTVHIDTPFDAELVALNASLNSTYIPYGASGEWSAGNQARQDSNASGMAAGVLAQRCQTKATGNYYNASWDLVDAMKDASFKLDSVAADQLPEVMRTMTLDQRRAYVEARAAERAEVQRTIAEVGAKRNQFIAAETAKMAAGSSSSFERAIRDAVRAQASARGLTFPAEAAVVAPGSGAPAGNQKPGAPAAGAVRPREGGAKEGC
jgi:hypothetical protein